MILLFLHVSELDANNSFDGNCDFEFVNVSCSVLRVKKVHNETILDLQHKGNVIIDDAYLSHALREHIVFELWLLTHVVLSQRPDTLTKLDLVPPPEYGSKRVLLLLCSLILRNLYRLYHINTDY